MERKITTVNLVIELKTRLDDGIYKSSGGGQTRTQKTWNLGPRNLLWAIEALAETRRKNEQYYGNIGCGGSWLEINNIRVNIDMNDLENSTTPSNWIDCRYGNVISKTQWAKNWIAEYVK